MKLHAAIKEDLDHRAAEARHAPDMLTQERAEAAFREFRDRFGPEVLQRLDGESLLFTMHGRGGEQESLVYWLEFKNDDVFPGRRFGSIAGGSAFKFGVYQRDSDGAWVTGTNVTPRVVTTQAAVEIARQQRNQFLAGVDVLARYRGAASSDDVYRKIQEQLGQSSPDLAKTAWGHKYLFLMFPEILDDYHEPILQRYQLVRLLQVPPDGSGLADTGSLGRFCCAGRFVDAAEELGLATFQLGYVLNQRNGRTRGYWRFGTTSDEQNGSRDYWPEMHSEGRVAVGYPMVGDIRPLLDGYSGQDLKRVLREEVARCKYPQASSQSEKAACTYDANVFYRLARAVQPGDVVLACRGATVHGIGRVTGDYRHVPGTDFAHARPVEWLDAREWRLPGAMNFRGQIITDLAKYPDILVEAERRLCVAAIDPAPKVLSLDLPPPPPIVAHVDAILRRKGQVVLYGPPGTGKTHWATVACRDLASRKLFKKPFSELGDRERERVGPSHDDEAVVQLASFHPGYGYENFLEGYRPFTSNGQLSFELNDGLFKRLCKTATAHPNLDYFLIIDEINRAEVPRVFGELLTSLELDKRAAPVHLPLSGEKLRVPDNLYVVGTMNTADRSISMLDAALRRRFGFIELMPDYDALQHAVIDGLSLSAWLEELNRRLLEVLPRDARSLQVGHAYLLERGRPVETLPALAAIIRDDILPLLVEYCYEDFAALERILGDGLIDIAKQRVRDELFAPNRSLELLEVLQTMFPGLGLTPSAAAAEAETRAADVVAEGTTDDVEPVGP